MKEIIFLNFGNTSNFVSTHFWNLNDEMFKSEDKFNIDNSVIYNESYQPRNLIFDYSENIRPYYISNEKLTNKQKKEIEDEYTINNKQFNINTFETDSSKEDNKFLDLINELGMTEEEVKEFERNNNKYIDEDQYDMNNKYKTDEILKLPEDKIYDYLEFQSSIKNWNDFLQPKYNKKSLNEIRTADVDTFARESYIKGYEFLSSENFGYTYLDPFEDKFRKFLEDCDRLENLHINVDFNSFWGGISNSMLETFNDSIPKIPKLIYGIDNHSCFYKKDDSFNEEKFLNYLWYFTDLYGNNNSDIIFMPIYKLQNPGFIREVFRYDFDFSINSHDPVYDFYFTSICGINLQNLYIPHRSKYFNSSTILTNLVHNNNINFIETDSFINLEDILFYPCDGQIVKNNGLIFNFARNFRHNLFSWNKIFSNSYRLNKFNSTIIHGYNEKYLIMGQKIDQFLLKHSAINYTCLDKFDIPLCYPRKIYPEIKSEVRFLKDISVMTNYRPFVEYPLKYL
jgi:hypothetical protein